MPWSTMCFEKSWHRPVCIGEMLLNQWQIFKILVLHYDKILFQNMCITLMSENFKQRKKCEWECEGAGGAQGSPLHSLTLEHLSHGPNYFIL